MLLHLALFVFLLTAGNSLGTPLPKSYLENHIGRPTLKFPFRRSQSLPRLDRLAALAARAATQHKFKNAPTLLAGQGVAPSYAIPSSLENIYDRASDYATNITLLSTFLDSFPTQRFSYRSSVVRVAAAGVNTTIDSLQDETDGVDDYEYYGPIKFGSQEQPLLMDFDTGSADMWVPVDCGNCGALSSFQANASNTYQNTTQPFSVVYGSGFVAGELAEDTVSVGPFKVYNQAIGAVQSVSENFADSPNDGLVGMAFGSIANSRKPTFFENLIPQLQAPLFSVYMTRKQVHGSEIYLGGIDASKASGDAIAWVPVVSKTYWTVSMTAASVNDTRVQTRAIKAIIDTGTSFIYLPTDVLTAIYKLVNPNLFAVVSEGNTRLPAHAQIPNASSASDYGDGFYAYPCDTPITVSFVLGSYALALDARDFNLGVYASDPTGRTCVAALVDGGPSFTFAILGDSFLKSFVSIYDYSHGARVGFVKSINE